MNLSDNIGVTYGSNYSKYSPDDCFIVNIMVGPPSNNNVINSIMSEFFSSKGKHIICGGTTAILASKYLRKELIVNLNYFDCKIPPSGQIEGVDIVTEGVITLGMVLERARLFINNGDGDVLFRSSQHSDSVSKICRMLFDDSKKINFFIGQAINEAHQKPGSTISFEHKMNIISELIDSLRNMKKIVTSRYY